MKRMTRKWLSVWLALAFVFSLTTRAATDPLPADTAPPDRGRLTMPFGLDPESGKRPLSFEDEMSPDDEDDGGDAQVGNRIQTEGGKKTDKAWLLGPGVFNQLSSAGQRAALRANGLLKARRAARQPIAQLEGIRPQANPGDNIRVNNPALDSDFHTHSETSVAANGQNIIVSFNEFDFDGYGISNDGGNTFTHKRIPVPSGGFNEGDGVVAFGPAGELYYAQLASVPGANTFNSIIGVSKSTDNGATFSAPVTASSTAADTTDFQDKEWIAVDRNATSPNKGNVYVSWTDFTANASGQSTGSFINFARSTDGGATWAAPINLSAQDGTSQVQGSVPVVAPDGDIYVAFSDDHAPFDGLAIRKSVDGGRTFSPEAKVPSLVSVSSMTGGGAVRDNSFPSIAVDNNGVVHIVFASWTVSSADRGDIFYVRSTDGGVTWSAPLKINDDATTTSQFLPSIAATTDGTLGVKWWDRRNDPINDSLTDVYMSISHDGGTTFGKNFRITDHNWVFGPIEIGFAGGYHGDYDDVVASGANFLISWSDERNGEADAFFTQIPENRDPNAPDFNISAKKLSDNIVAGNSAFFDLSTSGVNSFSSTLNLSASPAINGVTYHFASPSVNSGDTGSLTVSTNSSVQPGAYLISVAATGGGLTRSTNFRLTVLDPNRFAGGVTNASHTKGFTSMHAGVKADSTGTIHVVFDDDTNNVNEDDVMYTQSTDGGKTFSAPIKVSANRAGAFALQSTLALDPAGNPVIAWTGVNPNPSQGGFGTFLSRSMDHGHTFSAPIVVTGNARDAEDPKIAIDKNGNIVAVFVDFGLQGTPIFAVRSTDGGATFSTPSQVSQPGAGIDNPPYVGVDSNGATYVVFDDISRSVASIKIAIASDGQHFATPKAISNPNVTAFAPQIAVDNADNLYVAFYDRFAVSSSTFNREIVLVKSTDKGAAFSGGVNVSNDSGQSQFPSVAVDGQGRVSVAWEDTTTDPQRDVMVARSTDGGATFGPPINLSDDLGSSFGAFATADGNGSLYVGWTDDTGANTDVVVASLNPGTSGPADFAISTPAAILTVQRGTKTSFTINVNRVGGFTGNVTVTVPDLSSIKIKQPSGTALSTTGASVTFILKLKDGGPTGSLLLPLVAQDTTGRTRSGFLEMIIQPE